jgi:hypothetical protein
VICTEEFAALGREESRGLGLGGLPIVMVPHPIAGLPAEVARKMGEGIAEEVHHILTTPADALVAEYAARVFPPPKGLRRA